MRELRPFSSLLLASFTVAFAACSAHDSSTDRTMGKSTAAVHNTSTVDTAFPAVGFTFGGSIGYCSGTLIAPRLVLLAAHCAVTFAQSCNSMAQAIQGSNFYLYANGQRGVVTTPTAGGGVSCSGVGITVPDPAANTFQVDGVAVYPGAYVPKVTSCAAAGVTCAAAGSTPFGFVNAADIAVLHLATTPDLSVYPPLHVVTSLADSAPTPPPAFAVGDQGGTIHVEVDDPDTQFGGGIVAPTVVGWGNEDAPCGGTRATGLVAFAAGSDWDNTCVNYSTCTGVLTAPPGTPPCTGFPAGPFQDVGVVIHRTQSSPGIFDGPIPASGDSGSPLIVTLAGRPVILGVDSNGDSTSGNGTPAPNGDLHENYAATFRAGNAEWLERRVVDFDDDGIKDELDNCPTIANHNQANSNFDAEIALSSPHLGDACDPTPTTSSSVSSAPATGTMPCTLCGVALDGTVTCKKSTCTREVGSQLRFDSWIGNGGGNATSGPGMSMPNFCPCSLAVGPAGGTAACNNAHFGCIIGDDRLVRSSGAYEAVGWNPMTRFDSSAPHPYAPLTTLHQQSGDGVPSFIPTPTESIWDFFVDAESINTLPTPPTSSINSASPVVLWSNVTNFAPADSTENPNKPDLSDSYHGTTIIDKLDVILVAFQGLARSHDFDGLAWAIWHPGGWAPFERSADEGPPFFALPTLGGEAVPISQTSDRARDVRAYFDPAMLGALADVSRGAKELLIGDDVVAGIPQGVRAIPAIVVDPGTVNVSLAIQVDGERLALKIPSPNGQSGDPVRAYDAIDGQLLFIDTSNPTPALGAVDVRSALLGAPVTRSLPLHGDLPMRPLSLLWSGIEQSVYALDELSIDEKTKSSALRLLRINPATGTVRELWRTTATTHLPTSRLSVSPENEIVLSLTIDSHSEVVTLDIEGTPLRSLRFKGTLLAAAIGSEAGISLPLFKMPKPQTTDLDLRVVHRADMADGMCASSWLFHHIDRTTPNPLNLTRSACAGSETDDAAGTK